MADIRELTILHSNDMHGDFLAEEVDSKLVGGVSLLSGYLNKVRAEKGASTVYAVAGDMFRGSIIDSEFKGISTIEIMNYLRPDIVTLGNHELDYGIAHLMFLERCTTFPIVNANLYVNKTGTRLFDSHKVIARNGVKILFIGIITEEVLASTKSDEVLGSLVDVYDAAAEVQRICNAHKRRDIDLTVVLTHIGFEEDKKLASLIDPSAGVDLIIGGHSHTVLEQPEEVNGILIAQAGTGTDQIGRFDLAVDRDTNSIASYTWQLVPINGETCERDRELEAVIEGYKSDADAKYGRVLLRLPRALTHPRRNRETEVGRLFADMLEHSLGADIVFVGSGSLRRENFGPVIDLAALREMYPYDDSLYLLKVTGAQLRRMLAHLFRDDMFTNETEFYQVSSRFRCVYDCPSHTFTAFEFDGEPVVDDRSYSIVAQSFHFNSFTDFFGVPIEEVLATGGPARKVSSSCLEVFEELLPTWRNYPSGTGERLVLIDRPDGLPA